MTEPTKYESYIDTGNEWLGAIPSSWNTILLSQAVYQVKNKNSELQEKNLLSLSYGKIKRKPIDANGGLLPESFDGYNIIETNDIVLRLTDLQNDHRSLRVGISPERGIITSAYITLRPRKQSAAKYLYYLLHTFDIRKGFYGMGSGVRQGLNYDEVKRLKLPLPTEPEQKAISDYLDNELSRVDAIISEAKASVEEYKAWKASIIFEAVTKGLDPNVEMKDSGIEWIGEIPRGWEMVPIKRVVISRDGGAWGDDVAENKYDRVCMRIADFSFDRMRFKDHEKSLYTKRNYSSSQIERLTLKKGDILIEKSGGGEKTPVERAVLFDLSIPAVYANFMDRIRINKEKVLPHYFAYYWYAMYVKTVTTMYIKQTTGIQNLNLSSLLEKENIVFPSLSSQNHIVSYLDEKCNIIDSIVSEKLKLVDELESYKKSLIFEVVTGKRRVC